jgi:5-carboxymethyl-2-hydroxymuconate isomerase
MPHLVILYTPNLEGRTNLDFLCRSLADTMLAVKDEAGQQVFPTGGTRVLAYPATHYAVADGQGDYAFMYLNLRMAAGRSDAVKQQAGDSLLEAVKRHFAPIFEKSLIGITLQVDESPGQVYDGKHSTLHPLFAGAAEGVVPPLPVIPAPDAVLAPDVIPAKAGIQSFQETAEGGSSGSPPSRG